jgi:hemerythrin-like domain-containing protein
MYEKQVAATAPQVNRDAIGLLTADHRHARKLFDQFDGLKGQGSPDEKFAIAKQVCGDLLIHMAIEEAIFYPSVRRHIENEELVDSVSSEHDGPKDIIIQLGRINPGDPEFDAEMASLAEQIDRHVQHEESRIFPEVLMSDIDIAQLGNELAAARSEMRTNLGLPAVADDVCAADSASDSASNAAGTAGPTITA